MKTKISATGAITLPAELRRLDGIRPGEELSLERVGPGEYRLSRIDQEPRIGVVDWLLACPEKGYFVPLGTPPE